MGKSCVILRYIEEIFPGNIMSSIGVDFKSKQIEIDDKIVKMQIWDTAGHEKFRTITTSYYKSAHAILILYDITEQSSFEHIKNWMTEIDKFGKQGVLRVIVGNKIDLEKNRKVSKESAEMLAGKYGVKFFEVSAKDNTNIEGLFEDTVKCLLEKQLNNDMSASSSNNVILDNKSNIKINKKKGCC